MHNPFRNFRNSFSKVLLLGLPACWILAPYAWGQTADLPIRKVVLYKHGVGFFERAANVAAGESIRLQFKADEMDDVLKSLTIDSRGGAVVGVRYDSSDPLAKKLENFPFRLGGGDSLSRILDQFKGAKLRLRLTAEEIEGTIVSARTIAATERQAESHRLLLLSDDGEIQTVDPAAALGLRFVDTRLQEQFREYLMLIAGSRNREKRNVVIETEGGSGGSVSARYVVPTPVWKSSYRLVFDAEARPLLEGWAIVDNTSGEDWENVRLSLVSGRPVSFISRLYEPRYLTRPVAELAQDRAQRPIVHGAVIAAEPEEQAAGGRDQKRLAANFQSMAPPPAPQPAARELGRVIGGVADFAGGYVAPASAASSLAQTASTGELGDLFEYRIDRPITVRKGESAMLPFLQQRVAGRKLLIFSEANGSQHPLNAVEITNDSGITLDGGAVTVYDAAAYAGEALFETVKADDKRLISYAVDLGARITTAFDSKSKMMSEFTLRRGILTTRSSVQEIRTFTIRNVDQKPKTVIIERPARQGYKLLGEQPSEKTAKAYRYEVDVPAGETVKFPVTEERVVSQSVGVTNLTYDQLVTYVRNKDLSEAGRQKLEQIAEVKRRIADADRALQLLEKQVQERVQDQDRLRRNISSLRSVSGQQEQVQKYALKLSEQEAEITGMRDQQAELRRGREQSQTELNGLIETLVI